MIQLPTDSKHLLSEVGTGEINSIAAPVSLSIHPCPALDLKSFSGMTSFLCPETGFLFHI